MQPGSTLVLSGNELKTALEPSILTPGGLGIAREAATRKQPTEFSHADHIEGTGLSVGLTSTVTFRYIVRRVKDSVIVQRNDNRSYPVCQFRAFNIHGQTRVTT